MSYLAYNEITSFSPQVIREISILAIFYNDHQRTCRQDQNKVYEMITQGNMVGISKASKHLSCKHRRKRAMDKRRMNPGSEKWGQEVRNEHWILAIFSV